ncbi:MAG: caspase family protein, partial [Marinomonas sp.]
MFRLCLTLYVLVILSLSGGVEAKRVALIVGNSQYENTSTLANPANDAAVVAASAREAGFDDVIVAQNLSIRDFQRALRDFRIKANGADVAMVYYAGHGIEGQGKNWLIPVDAELNADLDLPYEAL